MAFNPSSSRLDRSPAPATTGDSLSNSFPKSVVQPPIAQKTTASLEYSSKLGESEKLWRDRYTFFLERGLELRPRYRPEWTPSWTGTSLNPSYCEDAIRQIIPVVLDARRHSDGTIVCIKRIKKKSDEVEIARFLSCGRFKDSKNHCVEILDSFRDPILPEVSYLVMPLLRAFDDPEFGAVGEVVDFVTQILEGTAFLHDQLISHGDLTGLNIMMDARPILPGGWHFVDDCFAPNGVDTLKPLARIDHPVRYFIIDFDGSVRFRPGDSHIWHGLGGRDREPPELATYKPYDHFKMDIFTLGNVLLKDLTMKYLGLDFLASLIDFMMTRDPSQRPTAQAVLDHWYLIRNNLPVSMARWRLRKPDESVGERVINTIAAARDGIQNLKYLFRGDEKKPWPQP